MWCVHFLNWVYLDAWLCNWEDGCKSSRTWWPYNRCRPFYLTAKTLLQWVAFVYHSFQIIAAYSLWNPFLTSFLMCNYPCLMDLMLLLNDFGLDFYNWCGICRIFILDLWDNMLRRFPYLETFSPSSVSAYISLRCGDTLNFQLWQENKLSLHDCTP